MWTSIKFGMDTVTAYTLEQLLADEGPVLIRCTGSGDNLQPVPEGLEVFGSTRLAIRTMSGELQQVTADDVVIAGSVDRMVIPIEVFNRLYNVK